MCVKNHLRWYSRRFLGENTSLVCVKMMGLYEAALLAPPPALFVRRTNFGISHHYSETDNHVIYVLRYLPLTFVFQAASCVLFCWTVSCCSRPREHGGVCAGEMPLAGYCVVDAFGYDVRAFVLKLQVHPSGRTGQLQRRTAKYPHFVCERWKSCPPPPRC